ncbi:unnamed protein product [Didymodactylos carnosus]|uniref:DDE Tnp4 domain-containing protein n=2 Tax=Didymodactylos carnosus TaxID=1234261 RepID=A0A8S2FS40_9BILA|nr:unnamed protein product [Didymodactylos carnosus]CAF4328776.1 unnamed protein product [Didymodactylos carnosus]
MVIVTTTGYIVSVFGPYLSDNKNNDTAIAKDILLKNKEDILHWADEKDIMVVDRGFPDSAGVMQSLGFDVAMPEFLDGRRRFDTTNANRSRFVTKIRWVVECVNGKLKHFNLLSKTLQNSTMSQVRDYLRIACALINAYGSPMVTPSPYTDKIAKFMLTSLKQENRIRLRVYNNPYNWKDINASNFVSFPVLTLDEIRCLTLGE